MTDARKTATPSGLAASGRRLWRGRDRLLRPRRPRGAAAHRGSPRRRPSGPARRRGSWQPVTSTNAKGDLIAHPAMVEARQQAIVLARLVASLRLPSGETADGLVRSQRRGAARGSYGIRGAVG